MPPGLLLYSAAVLTSLFSLPDPQLDAQLAGVRDVEGKLPRTLQELGPIADRSVVVLGDGASRLAHKLREMGGQVDVWVPDAGAPEPSPGTVDVVVVLGDDLRAPSEAAEHRIDSIGRMLRHPGRLLVVLHYGRDDVSRLADAVPGMAGDVLRWADPVPGPAGGVVRRADPVPGPAGGVEQLAGEAPLPAGEAPVSAGDAPVSAGEAPRSVDDLPRPARGAPGPAHDVAASDGSPVTDGLGAPDPETTEAPDYAALRRRDRWFLAHGFKMRVVHGWWTFDAIADATSFLSAAFGASGEAVAAGLRRPRLSYKVVIYHRTFGATPGSPPGRG